MVQDLNKSSGLGTVSTLSIGIGGMVGGGIFAVTGLSIDVTKGGAPIAFLIAGIVALLTSYSYLKLTLRYPGEGGTVYFLNTGFGNGVITGTMNLLLLFSYVVLVSVYAYAFGSYGATFFSPEDREFWHHTLMSSALVGYLFLNIWGSKLVINSENFFNLIKMILLAGFVIAGLVAPMEWDRLDPANYVTPIGTIAGAMLIFLNYEGFELISNASNEIAKPKRSLPIAYIGGVVIVMVFYFLIVSVVVGQLSFVEVAKESDQVLLAAANKFMGTVGFIAIAVAALLATSSAINATFFSTGKLTYIIAQSGEMPDSLERSYKGQHTIGTLISAVVSLLVANFVPLEAIATMGSAGFLLVFMMVNVANVRLAQKTESSKLLSTLAALSAAFALVVLCIEVDENPATRNHIWILVGMILLSLLIEIIYRLLRNRELHW